MSPPLTHYVVIRRDLTFGEYSAQLAHAGEAYVLVVTPKISGHDHPPPFEFNQTIAIVKGIRNEGRLLKLEAALIAEGVPHVAIREETGEKGGRIAGQLTCISILPQERSEKLDRLLTGIHTIQGLDPIRGSSVQSADSSRSEAAGSTPAPGANTESAA